MARRRGRPPQGRAQGGANAGAQVQGQLVRPACARACEHKHARTLTARSLAPRSSQFRNKDTSATSLGIKRSDLPKAASAKAAAAGGGAGGGGGGEEEGEEDEEEAGEER